VEFPHHECIGHFPRVSYGLSTPFSMFTLARNPHVDHLSAHHEPRCHRRLAVGALGGKRELWLGFLVMATVDGRNPAPVDR